MSATAKVNKTFTNVTVQIRNDTAANWAASGSKILAKGELGYDSTNNILKVGDGTSSWTSLEALSTTVSTVEPSTGSDKSSAVSGAVGVIMGQDLNSTEKDTAIASIDYPAILIDATTTSS